MENINISKLVAEIKINNSLIKEHKQNTRRPHPASWQCDENFREIAGKRSSIQNSQSVIFWKFKPKITLLCALRAHLRGKVHFKGKTYEEQEAFLKKYANKWSEFIEIID